MQIFLGVTYYHAKGLMDKVNLANPMASSSAWGFTEDTWEREQRHYKDLYELV